MSLIKRSPSGAISILGLVVRALGLYLGLVFVQEGLLREEYDQRAADIAGQAHARAQADPRARDTHARWSVDARNQLKDEIRQRGNPVTKAWAEQRNLAKYGDILGPTYQELSTGLLAKGVAPDSVDWKIMGSAGRTSREVSLVANSLLVYGLALTVLYAVWFLAMGLRTPAGQRLAWLGREVGLMLAGCVVGMGLSYVVAAIYPF
jgi:hypothetical protein